MDVLSEVISSIHIDGSALCELRCGGSWGIDMGTGQEIPFHYVTEGQCWLLGNGSPICLSTGDLVVALHWPRHALASSPENSLTPMAELITANGLQFWTKGTLERPLRVSVGDDKPNVKVLTGVFSLNGRIKDLLVERLPSIMHFSVLDQVLAPQLKMVLDFIEYESQAVRPGYVAVASRLMDLLFIQVLRAAVMQPLVHVGLLAGLADTNINRALAAIHASPSTSWTVSKLADKACLSRTTFAARFRQTVEMTPIQYVVRWRMMVAEDLLAHSDLSVEQIRGRLGYESSFVFARAFRAYSGRSPREFRRTVQAA